MTNQTKGAARTVLIASLAALAVLIVYFSWPKLFPPDQAPNAGVQPSG